MADFGTSLLREKFVIEEKSSESKESEGDSKGKPMIALSNRLCIPLVSKDGVDKETYIVRTQNMHTCCRFAAAIVKEFEENGPLTSRKEPFDWQALWHSVIRGYEKDWNNDIWSAVYVNGRLLYQEGDHHPFLDIIEQCDVHNKEEYGKSVLFAERAFAQAGKDVDINYDANVALILAEKEKETKCGIIVRTASGATTFNFTAAPSWRHNDPVQLYTTMTVAASFLEATQLAFFIGLTSKKLQYQLIEKYSDGDRQYAKAKNRLANLNRAITNYENRFTVNYRPDRPNFKNMVEQAEEFSMTILKPQIEAMLESGALNKDEWITE